MFYTGNKHIIVNYHYIENPKPDAKGMFSISIKKFNKQISFLKSNFSIVSIEEVYEAAKINSDEKFCSITFDDCMKDQWNNALPILEKNNMLATFFPISSTFHGKVPMAHKIHTLLSGFDIIDLINRFNFFIKSNYPTFSTKYYIPKDKRLIQRRLHEDIPSANFKEVFSVLPPEISSVFLDQSFSHIKITESDLCKRIFMSKEDIFNLHKKGHVIGGHTHNHKALDSMDIKEVVSDTIVCKEELSRIIGYNPSIFSYPHGRYNENVLSVISEAGFNYGVTIDRRAIGSNDSQMAIPRFDAMDIDCG